MRQDEQHWAAAVQLGEGGVEVGGVGDRLRHVGRHRGRVERCWWRQGGLGPDSKVLNKEHVHEVEGRQSDG